MSTKKEKRYCTLGTDSEMILQLDPDIYDAGTTLKLGITSVAGANKKTVPVTLAQASKSTGATLLRVTVTRGAGDLEEFRVIKLLCETSKVVAAKAGALLGDTVKLGGTVTSNWTIKSVT